MPGCYTSSMKNGIRVKAGGGGRGHLGAHLTVQDFEEGGGDDDCAVEFDGRCGL